MEVALSKANLEKRYSDENYHEKPRKKSFFSLYSLSIFMATAFFVIFCIHEYAKLNACFVEKSNLINRDFGAKTEDVCVDPYKISQYSHRFADGCKSARDSVDQGIILSSIDCFIAQHNLYKMLAFEDRTFNYCLGATLVLLSMWILLLVKNYFVQMADVQNRHETHREFLSVFQQMKMHEKCPKTPGTKKRRAAIRSITE